MNTIDELIKRAGILTEALPYIQKLHNKTIVIKYGGNAMINEDLKRTVMEDITLLKYVGMNPVIVHGGGPDISAELKTHNVESEFVNGLRVTDADTIKIAQMVLVGKTNKEVVSNININGGNAVGLCGIDGHMIKAEQLDEKLGYVGEITDVDVTPILDVLEKGYIPVISSVGCDDEGNSYNINADTAAARIAGELQAECLISMTDIEGILRDKNDPSTLISKIYVSEAPQLVKEGIISGGMIPKVNCCIESIRRGVGKVFIIDGRVPHSILIETLTDEGMGTMFVSGD